MITACPGNRVCKHGQKDSQDFAKEIDEKFFGTELPHKFKVAVSGCPNACTKPRENDIGFSGYWPERGAFVKTCSFKELEAYPIMQYLRENGAKAIVLASAGNTGRAAAHASALTGMDVYIVVPYSGISSLWLPEKPIESIHFISMSPGNDYTDAINLAGRIARLPGMVSEGGARNVARRDGMGTVMLDAAVTIGKMPDHYFQAVGSGTGGISAW